jgi:ribonuclease I
MFLFAVVVFAQDGGPSSIQSSIQGNIQDKRQNASGQFDFYVLALSWSPSYCAAARARHPDGKDSMQCGSRPFAFVVHGLWPQYEKGFPSYCQVPAPKLDRGQVAGALDMMPSPSLVMHEWERHGTCSGLSAAAYFETVRKARATVKDPTGLSRPGCPAHRFARRRRRGLRQDQSGTRARRHGGRLRQDAADRGASVHGQGFLVPCLS